MTPDGLAGFETIEVDSDGVIVTVRLNRPEQSNAINWTMEHEIHRVLEHCEASDTVKCAVIVANGRNFSAGHDISQVAKEKINGSEPPTFRGQYWARTGDMLPTWNFSKALIMAVKGFVGPHANAFLLTADVVIAADNTTFSFEESRIGIGAPFGAYALMPFHFPLRVLKQLWIPGGWMDAQTAKSLHYVNRVVALGDEEAEARRFAEMYAAMELSNLIANKRGVHAIYESAGLLEMLEVGRAPYEHQGSAAEEVNEHFRIIHEQGAGAAARNRDSAFDRELSKI